MKPTLATSEPALVEESDPSHIDEKRYPLSHLDWYCFRNDSRLQVLWMSASQCQDGGICFSQSKSRLSDWVTWARHVAKRFYARSSAHSGGVIQLNKYLKSGIVRGRCSEREALLDKKWVPRSEAELCIKEFEHEYWQGQGDNAGNEHSYVEGVSRYMIYGVCIPVTYSCSNILFTNRVTTWLRWKLTQSV